MAGDRAKLFEIYDGGWHEISNGHLVDVNRFLTFRSLAGVVHTVAIPEFYENQGCQFFSFENYGVYFYSERGASEFLRLVKARQNETPGESADEDYHSDEESTEPSKLEDLSEDQPDEYIILEDERIYNYRGVIPSEELKAALEHAHTLLCRNIWSQEEHVENFLDSMCDSFHQYEEERNFVALKQLYFYTRKLLLLTDSPIILEHLLIRQTLNIPPRFFMNRREREDLSDDNDAADPTSDLANSTFESLLGILEYSPVYFISNKRVAYREFFKENFNFHSCLKIDPAIESRIHFVQRLQYLRDCVLTFQLSDFELFYFNRIWLSHLSFISSYVVSRHPVDENGFQMQHDEYVLQYAENPESEFEPDQASSVEHDLDELLLEDSIHEFIRIPKKRRRKTFLGQICRRLKKRELPPLLFLLSFCQLARHLSVEERSRIFEAFEDCDLVSACMPFLSPFSFNSGDSITIKLPAAHASPTVAVLEIFTFLITYNTDRLLRQSLWRQIKSRSEENLVVSLLRLISEPRETFVYEDYEDSRKARYDSLVSRVFYEVPKRTSSYPPIYSTNSKTNGISSTMSLDTPESSSFVIQSLTHDLLRSLIDVSISCDEGEYTRDEYIEAIFKSKALQNFNQTFEVYVRGNSFDETQSHSLRLLLDLVYENSRSHATNFKQFIHENELISKIQTVLQLASNQETSLKKPFLNYILIPILKILRVLCFLSFQDKQIEDRLLDTRLWTSLCGLMFLSRGRMRIGKNYFGSTVHSYVLSIFAVLRRNRLTRLIEFLFTSCGDAMDTWKEDRICEELEMINTETPTRFVQPLSVMGRKKLSLRLTSKNQDFFLKRQQRQKKINDCLEVMKKKFDTDYDNFEVNERTAYEICPMYEGKRQLEPDDPFFIPESYFDDDDIGYNQIPPLKRSCADE